ncbi:MAG: SdpI family protein [Chloroflexi bacterium]|nr:SdpI family protein [Chloroflexota bacterium]
MTLLLVMFAGTGLLLAALAIPMMQRRVKPNGWYGFRTKSTLSNPDLWYDANAYAGRLLLIFGVLVVVSSILLALVPDITIDGYSIVMLVVTMVGSLIMLVLCWNFLRAYPHNKNKQGHS